VQRDSPGFAELAVAHHQQPVRPVDVVEIQRDRLAAAHPCRGEQGDHRLVGVSAQRVR
jgi:hypothetical protein